MVIIVHSSAIENTALERAGRHTWLWNRVVLKPYFFKLFVTVLLPLKISQGWITIPAFSPLPGVTTFLQRNQTSQVELSTFDIVTLTMWSKPGKSYTARYARAKSGTLLPKISSKDFRHRVQKRSTAASCSGGWRWEQDWL